MNLLDDLGAKLTADGLGTVDTDIFLGIRPAQPDQVLVLQTYLGDASRLFDANSIPADERLNVQVTSRGAKDNSLEAENRARAAWQSLSARHIELNNTQYDWIRALQYPAFMGLDEVDRPLIVFNLSIRRRGQSL